MSGRKEWFEAQYWSYPPALRGFVLSDEISDEFGDNTASNVSRKNSRGIFSLAGFNGVEPVRIAQVTDGTSNTLLIGEYHTISNSDWATKWGVPFAMTCLSEVQHHFVTRGLADYDRCFELHPGSGSERQGDCRRSFASMHGAGVINFSYADGHVISLTPEIDPIVWKALATFTGEEVVEADL